MEVQIDFSSHLLEKIFKILIFEIDAVSLSFPVAIKLKKKNFSLYFRVRHESQSIPSKGEHY